MKICYSGDSIAHGTDFDFRKPRSVGDFILYQLAGWTSRDICFPTDKIADQTTRWNQLTAAEKESFDFIFCMNGNNDMNAATVVANFITTYQVFFDLLKAETKSSCKVFSMTMTPYSSGDNAAYVAKRAEINEALIGGGPTPLINFDYPIDEHTAYLDDGTGNNQAKYWHSPTDPLHLNELGRDAVASACVQKLKERNLI